MSYENILSNMSNEKVLEEGENYSIHLKSDNVKVLCCPNIGIFDVDVTDHKYYWSAFIKRWHSRDTDLWKGKYLRVYKTFGGFRIFVLNQTVSPKGQWFREASKFLHADPLYVNVTDVQGMFRARLEPKPCRKYLFKEHHVCEYVTTLGDLTSRLVIPNEVWQVILIHDEYTLSKDPGSILA